MKNRKAKRTRAFRGTLTISLPDELIKYLREKKNYSSYVASLIRSNMQQQAGAQETNIVSSEEAEIRQALKERDRLLEIYGDRVYDVEHVILRQEEWVNGTGWVTIKDWRRCMEQKGIADEHGYFNIYAKYCSLESPEELLSLWSDVKEKVEEEKEKEHELRLKTEVAKGMTLQEAIDKLGAYLKRQLNKKIEQLKLEAEKIPFEDAYSTFERKQANEHIEALQAKFEAKEVSMKEVVAALGLPYMVAYNKVAPLLRREGYKIH